jgi:hypothetical protein
MICVARRTNGPAAALLALCGYACSAPVEPHEAAGEEALPLGNGAVKPAEAQKARGASLSCATVDEAQPLAGAFAIGEKPWPNGIIPFRIHPSAANNAGVMFAINKAITHYNFTTPVRLVPDDTATASSFVLFTADQTGCFTDGTGFTLGMRRLNLQPNACDKFDVAVHELGHVIGLHHEMRRSDRDNYILIQDGKVHGGIRTRDNIFDDRKSQFTVYNGPGYQVGTFDFDSVMLYPAMTNDTRFARNVNLPIITRRDGSIYPNPQTGGLSTGDLFTTFQLYPPPLPVANAHNTCQTAPRKRGAAATRTDLAALWNSGGEVAVSNFPSQGSSFGARVQSAGSGTWNDASRFAAGDFDGDGRTDVVSIVPHVSKAEGMTVVSTNALLVRLAAGQTFQPARGWAYHQGLYQPTNQWLPGDFNNDGRDDLAVVWNDGERTSISVFVSTGTSFRSAEHWSVRDGGWDASIKWVVGDFNGDNRADIAAIWNNGGTNTLTVRASTGAGFAPQHWAFAAGGWMNNTKWLAGDFNADGFSDLAGIWQYGQTNAVAVYLSSGSAVPGWNQWSTEGGWIEWARWTAGDFNGDGRTDLAAVWNYGGQNVLTVRQSTGSSFTPAHWATGAGGWLDATQWCAGRFR